MLAKHPNFFVEFQEDAKVNNIVAAKFGAANIPMLAVDVPGPGRLLHGREQLQGRAHGRA